MIIIGIILGLLVAGVGVALGVTKKAWTSPQTIALLAVGGVIVLVSGLLYMQAEGLKSDRNDKEAALSSAYLNDQNYLSDCIVKTNAAVQVAAANTDAVNRVLTDAISGRYGDSFRPARPGESGALISAFKEVYPDKSIEQVTSLYNKAITVIAGCRTDFRDKQSQLLDMLRDYRSFRGQYWARQLITVPSNNLVAQNGKDIVRGQAAEDKMAMLVRTSSTDQAFNTGTIPDNDQLFPTTTVATSTS